MTGNEIRRKFLEFFAHRDHKIVRSSSLVPANDPTLLFTNAGMNQFKDVFLGLERRDYTRAASSQKCVRAGGKHNDLDNVGKTTRHHTFFEMLGNFSFGDYFKRDAIAYAWELVTKDFGIPENRLYPTVFREDDESYEIWHKGIGVPADRIGKFGEEDNFWAMGDTGPCGPCSEIYYDFGPSASDEGHKACAFPCECGRYVEFWNLVFMQYNREEPNQISPLPRPSIDTGLGLERMAAIVQGKTSNYETDLLRPLIEKASELSGREYGDAEGSNRDDVALRVIADHSRAIAFLVSDGVLPSNEGRGYVLRKIMRRAADFGRLLGLTKPFLFEMVAHVAGMMRDPYPEVHEGLQRISTIVKAEEHRYAHTIPPAVERFRKQMAGKKVQTAILDGRDMFFAYDTLGLRPDYLRDLAMEWDWQVTPQAEAEFEEAMKAQRERAKASWKGVGREAANPVYQKLAETHRSFFDGYHQIHTKDCRIVALVAERGSADEVPARAECEVVLDHTPFYAEAGGQVGDTGAFWDPDLTEEWAEVKSTYHPLGGIIAHRVLTRVPMKVGDHVAAVVQAETRMATARNHTATHLLHAALRSVLGPHVKQSGSVVGPERLRFDFSHYTAVDPEELEEIERLVNEQIQANGEVHTEVTDLDAALASGAIAFFGDKYPEQNVRVVTVPNFSKELCGGTHVRRTGDIGLCKITSEGSIAAGIRRVEAITGQQALEDYRRAVTELRELAMTLNTSVEELPQQIQGLVEEHKRLKKNQDALRRRLAQSQVDELIEQVRLVKDIKVLSVRLEEMDRPEMRSLADSLRQKIGSGVIVLGSSANGKVAIVSAVTKDLVSRLHAGKIVQAVAARVGGTGGGRPDLAEAGGKDATELDQAIKDVYGIVEAML